MGLLWQLMDKNVNASAINFTVADYLFVILPTYIVLKAFIKFSFDDAPIKLI